MNLKKEIARLLNRSKTISTIRFFPYTSGLPLEIIQCNVALRCAETEEVRWRLFLGLLHVWLHRRSESVGKVIFGSMPLWHKPNSPPLVIGADRSTGGFSLYQDQLIVAEIRGDSALVRQYLLTMTRKKLALTLAEYNRG